MYEMKNPLANIKGNKLLYLITATSSSGFLLFGYDNGVFSGINVLPWFLTTFSKNTNIFSTINAIFLVGAALGALVTFIMGDRLGRRWTIFMGCVIGVIGAIVQGTPTEVVQLIIGRVVSGVAVGVLTSTVGVWQAETTPAAVRGRYMSMQLFFGGFGNLLSTWISYGFHNTEGRLPFMFPLLFQMVFPVVTGSLILFLPESPRWLIKKGRVEEAVAIMKRLQGFGPADEAPDSTISEEVRTIMEVDRLEKESKGIFGGMFRNGPTRNFKRILLGCAVTSFHQLNGINSISYYVPTLATNFIGAPRSEALWINGLNSIWVITFSIIPVLFLDRFGRRVFLWFPTCIQALAFVIVAILLSQAPPVSTHGGADSYGIAILSFIFLFSAVNDASWFGTSWVYPAELMPLHLREKGMGLAVILYWLFDFMMVEITPIALTNIGYKFYVILAVFNVVIAALIYFFFPETANKTLEEIDLQFAGEWQVSTDAKVVGVEPKNSVPAGEGSGQNGNDGAAPSEMSEERA
jgi:sugar porter (SP) family MFS transporter